MPGAPDAIVLDEHCVAYRKDNPAMRAAFEAAAGGRTRVRSGGKSTPTTPPSPTSSCSTRARPISWLRRRASRTGSGPLYLDIADRLAVESGRPVLIVPNEGLHKDFGKKVLVAWNARREAARAVFDALPLLQQADEVKVVWVNPQDEGGAAADVPAGDICAALARHGVKCEATEVARPQAGVGRTLLMRAAEYGSDLLVMGCYGHSRLREFVLGGASRHVLDHMTIPVLMSH